MTTSAPRLAPELLHFLATTDDGALSYAELTRRLGTFAETHGLTRPSYERVRTLVHLARSLRTVRRARRGPSVVQMLVEARLGVRSYGSVMDNVGLPREERWSVWR